MQIGHWSRLSTVAFLAPLLLAGAPAFGTQAEQVAPTSIGEKAEGGIVVTAPTQKRSNWKRAETDHVVIFSDGGESELVRIAVNVERLHALMTRLYGAAGQQTGAPKLEIMLFASHRDIGDLGLRDIRADEGPFSKTFINQRYYDPRAYGTVLVIARSDQVVDLNTGVARDRFCEDLAAQGTDCIGKREPHVPPVVRPWESIVYSAFAQHFILSNVPAPYPRWYLDGIGALFSTIEVRKDGSLTYAKPPDFAGQIFRSYGDVNARDVLTGSYLKTGFQRMRWTPYHAWLITHFFVFSDLKPALKAQFAQYMAAIARGASLAEAAGAFKDLSRLNRDVMGYASKAKAFATTQASDVAARPPSVTVLSYPQVAALKAKVRLGDLPPPGSSSTMPQTARIGSAALLWIANLRAEAGQPPFDLDAMLIATEAECRVAQVNECLTDAEQILARFPYNARALAWKGMAQTEQALADSSAKRENALAAARETIEHALQIDPHDAVAAIAYFQSYAKAGTRVPDTAMAVMAKLATAAPAAPTPRILLAEELVRQSKSDLAVKVLSPVLYGAYDSPEKEATQLIFLQSSNNLKRSRQISQ